MSFELNNKQMRLMKRNLIDSNKTEFFNGKCPHCNSIIEFAEVFTAPLEVGNEYIVPELNEKGVMIGKCNNYDCRYYFKLEVFNPDFSEFNSGATKVDNYIYSDNEIGKLNEYEYIRFMTEFIDKDTTFKIKNDNYDFERHPLYICETCEQNLEPIAFSKLEMKWVEISKEYWNYTNWALSRVKWSPKNIVVNFQITCHCGKECIAKFVSNYHEYIDFDRHSFALLDVYGAKSLPSCIVGVHSKTTIMNWLYKLISRWNFLFDKVYIISPFISHQYAKNEKRVETWVNIISRLDSKKTTILTKGKEVKSFKSAFSDINCISYEDMDSYRLGSDLVGSLRKNNSFHAKIYCGISNGVCEVLSGSSNLIEGPTQEVISFVRLFDYKKTYSMFLEPLNIDDITDELVTSNSREYSLFFDEGCNFKPFDFKKCDYIDYVINNITPRPAHI